MSKQVKEMIIREYKSRMSGFNDATLISIRGVKAQDTTKLRGVLRKKKVKLSVLRNSLAKKALAGSGVEPLFPLMEGNSALVYGEASVVEVARELTKILADMPNIELKGAVLDGTLFKGEKGIKELSKYPTKAEAQGQLITLVLGPARKLAAQIKGPGANIAGLVKAIETKLEKGETIAKKA
jgi:large subunit ribosomal protein L10